MIRSDIRAQWWLCAWMGGNPELGSPQIMISDSGAYPDYEDIIGMSGLYRYAGYAPLYEVRKPTRDYPSCLDDRERS